MRYRIDVKRSIGYTDEKARIAAYREMGWEYVCDLTPYLDIYRCDDPAAPELNTDEETLHQVLDRRLRSISGGATRVSCLPLSGAGGICMKRCASMADCTALC